MNDKLLKPYNPPETEDRIYKTWEDSGFFNPDNLPERHKEPFTIVLPPPNVTGVLHLGHAYEDTLQDSIIRFERMRGKRALWIPGTDEQAKQSRQQLLLLILKKSVTILHPFMPFVTEEIWSMMGKTDTLLMVEPWPHLS